MNRQSRPMARALLLASILATIAGNGCVVSSESTSGTAPRIPDPVDRKCVEDQYELVYIYENGVARWSVCVDRTNNRKCETLAYFRGECSLGEGTGSNPHTPVTPTIPRKDPGVAVE